MFFLEKYMTMDHDVKTGVISEIDIMENIQHSHQLCKVKSNKNDENINIILKVLFQ